MLPEKRISTKVAIDAYEAVLEAAIDVEADQERALSLLGSIENLGESTAISLIRYVAAASLWDACGQQYATDEQQNDVIVALRSVENPMSTLFDDGVLESIVGVLSGAKADGQSVPTDQALSALVAVTIYCLRQPDPEFETWRHHYRYVAEGWSEENTDSFSS